MPPPIDDASCRWQRHWVIQYTLWSDMARSLQFEFGDQKIECGRVDIETLDMDGGRCALATLANDGKTLIPFGGTAFGYVNPDGEWITRNDLNPVDQDGAPLSEVPSSFDGPIILAERASEEEFLDHSIRLSYALTPETDFNGEFLKCLNDGQIFKLPFSYRGGVTADPAFVLKGGDDTVWLLIGSTSTIEFVALEQAAICAATQDEDSIDEDDDDELDFSML